MISVDYQGVCLEEVVFEVEGFLIQGLHSQG